MTNDFLTDLTNEFIKKSNSEIASKQKAYMRNKFDFFGLQFPIRRKIQRPFMLKANLPSKNNLSTIIKSLWLKSEREYQYFAQELTEKYAKQFDKKDIELFEFMIIHKSWWDTIDFIAVKLVGVYLKIYPEQIKPYIEKWLNSNNIWLQRTAILFQLNYKNELDTELLTYIINSLVGSNEFFINKAIGWILRQYSKTNPDWVINFVAQNQLSKLSRYEALRLIKS